MMIYLIDHNLHMSKAFSRTLQKIKINVMTPYHFAMTAIFHINFCLIVTPNKNVIITYNSVNGNILPLWLFLVGIWFSSYQTPGASFTNSWSMTRYSACHAFSMSGIPSNIFVSTNHPEPIGLFWFDYQKIDLHHNIHQKVLCTKSQRTIFSSQQSKYVIQHIFIRFCMTIVRLFSVDGSLVDPLLMPYTNLTRSS